MKFKLYTFLVLFTSALIVSTYAQSGIKILKQYNKADSINVNPYSFLPMQIGNFWQYTYNNIIYDGETVVKDSTIENGSKLIWIDNYPRYLIDTNYTVFTHGYDGQLKYVAYKLDAELDDEWIAWQSSADSTQAIVRKVEAVFLGDYLGVETIFKRIAEYDRNSDGDFIRFRYVLGAGLGLIEQEFESIMEPSIYLISAIINGDTLGTIVGVKELSDNLDPKSIELSQNYPNPFNPSTNISFSIPKQEFVTLKIYDVLGKEIVTLVNEELAAGNHVNTWNAPNVSSGVYFYKLQAGKFSETKKMILIK